MKQKNARSLDTIADKINGVARGNIIDVGDLLLEAKGQCEHGQWLDWLSAEFTWSVDTAERYMKVAELAARFRNLRNLKLGVTTLYDLADHEDEEDLPAIIKELAKHATKKPLRPGGAGRVIKIGIGRRRFGDLPDAALVQLMELVGPISWHKKVLAALQEREPDTDESARLLVDEVIAELEAEEEEAEIKDDDAEYEAEQAEKAATESILDGAPPELPPTAPPAPQKFGADTEWAGTESFTEAVTALLALRTKPVARFVGKLSPSELREVADFLSAIASHGTAEDAAA